MKPVIVELDYTRPDFGKPHWGFYFWGWTLKVLGFMAIAASFFAGGDSFLLWYLVFLLAFCVGTSLENLGRFVREIHESRKETSNLLATQAERIRKLEEQVAALTAASTPTHTHAA